MQDLASEFPKFSGVIPPDPHSGWGDSLTHPTPGRVGRGAQAPHCWDPNLWSPSTFQPWLCPWVALECSLRLQLIYN